MTKQQDFSAIEKNLFDAAYTEAPSSQFVSNLWARIENLPTKPAPLGNFRFQIPRFRLLYAAAATVMLVILAFFAIGPARVIAALQSLMQYIPGLGYVDNDTTLRIVKPFAQTIDGLSISVPAGVVDGEKTVIRFSYTGIELPTPGPAGPQSLCLESPHLRLPDGSVLPGGSGMTGTEDHIKVEGHQSFASIPPDIQSFDLVFPCLSYMDKKSSPKDLVLHLQLEPMPPDYPAYQVIELPAASTMAAASPSEAVAVKTDTPSPETDGIQFSVDRMAELPDGYLFEGSLTWPTGVYSFANLFISDIQVTDANGVAVEVEEAPDQGLSAGYVKGKSGWAVVTKRKDHVFPLTFTLPKVNVSQLEQERAFNIDLGSHPEVGMNWDLDYRKIVANSQVTIRKATIAELPGGFSHNLYLNVEGESPAGNEASLSFKLDDSSKFPSCEELNGGAGGGGGGGGMDSSGNGGSFSTLIFLGCQPQGVVTVRLDSASYDLSGPWEAEVKPPGK